MVSMTVRDDLKYNSAKASIGEVHVKYYTFWDRITNKIFDFVIS